MRDLKQFEPAIPVIPSHRQPAAFHLLQIRPVTLARFLPDDMHRHLVESDVMPVFIAIPFRGNAKCLVIEDDIPRSHGENRLICRFVDQLHDHMIEPTTARRRHGATVQQTRLPGTRHVLEHHVAGVAGNIKVLAARQKEPATGLMTSMVPLGRGLK